MNDLKAVKDALLQQGYCGESTSEKIARQRYNRAVEEVCEKILSFTKAGYLWLFCNNRISLEGGRTYVTRCNKKVKVTACRIAGLDQVIFFGDDHLYYGKSGVRVDISGKYEHIVNPDPIVAEIDPEEDLPILAAPLPLTLELDKSYTTPSGRVVKIVAMRMLLLEADTAAHRKLDKYIAYEGTSANPFSHNLYLSNGTAIPTFTSRGFAEPENLVEIHDGDTQP